MPVALAPVRIRAVHRVPMTVPPDSLSRDEIARRVFALQAELAAWFVQHLPEGFAHEAEDLVQEVAVVAVKEADRFVWCGNDEFRGWVYTIARSRRADWMEHHTAAKRNIRRRQELAASSGSEPLATVPGRSEPVSGPLRRKERFAKLLAALESHLSAKNFQLLTLKFLDAQTDAVIGQLTGMSEVAVRQAVHRALVKVREVLNLSDFDSAGG